MVTIVIKMIGSYSDDHSNTWHFLATSLWEAPISFQFTPFV